MSDLSGQKEQTKEDALDPRSEMIAVVRALRGDIVAELLTVATDAELETFCASLKKTCGLLGEHYPGDTEDDAEDKTTTDDILAQPDFIDDAPKPSARSDDQDDAGDEGEKARIGGFVIGGNKGEPDVHNAVHTRVSMEELQAQAARHEAEHRHKTEETADAEDDALDDFDGEDIVDMSGEPPKAPPPAPKPTPKPTTAKESPKPQAAPSPGTPAGAAAKDPTGTPTDASGKTGAPAQHNTAANKDPNDRRRILMTDIMKLLRKSTLVMEHASLEELEAFAFSLKSNLTRMDVTRQKHAKADAQRPAPTAVQQAAAGQKHPKGPAPHAQQGQTSGKAQAGQPSPQQIAAQRKAQQIAAAKAQQAGHAKPRPAPAGSPQQAGGPRPAQTAPQAGQKPKAAAQAERSAKRPGEGIGAPNRPLKW